ncbi:uncharacterized protein LOC144160544 [Haemaphysalis longicornis]
MEANADAIFFAALQKIAALQSSPRDLSIQRRVLLDNLLRELPQPHDVEDSSESSSSSYDDSGEEPDGPAASTSEHTLGDSELAWGPSGSQSSDDSTPQGGAMESFSSDSPAAAERSASSKKRTGEKVEDGPGPSKRFRHFSAADQAPLTGDAPSYGQADEEASASLTDHGWNPVGGMSYPAFDLPELLEEPVLPAFLSFLDD